MAELLAGGIDGFDAVAYGRPHPNTLQFLENQVYQSSQGLNQAGQMFMAKAAQIFEDINGSNAMRILKAAGRAVRSLWQPNEIREISDIGQLQHAPLAMHRWIMAEPTTRALYHRQGCDGYSDSYVDWQAKVIGEDHYDYRRAMNGLVVEDEDGGWHATTYAEELLPDDRELDFEEQVDIQHTWNAVKAHILAKGEDPTSKYNSSL